eukprot:2472915-Amphidinium_carterae.1
MPLKRPSNIAWAHCANEKQTSSCARPRKQAKLEPRFRGGQAVDARPQISLIPVSSELKALLGIHMQSLSHGMACAA